MDSIGGVLNPIGQMPKTHYKKEFSNGFTGKKLMVYNGILMETIGISVIVYIGLLLFILAGFLDIWLECKTKTLSKRMIFLPMYSPEVCYVLLRWDMAIFHWRGKAVLVSI